MLFKIDFTRPHLYEDAVTLNQGNLSTNNTLRCRIVTGGNDDVTGASIVCTFVINGKQIFESGKVVDGPRGIVDVVFPSEALVVGENTLEFLVNRVDGSVAQSPVIKYRVWQGLTTDEGVRADSNYPLLVELINQVNSAVGAAGEALEGANSVIVQGEELKASVDKLKADCIASVDAFTKESSNKVDGTITQNVAKVDAAVAKNEASVVKADAAAEKAILAANNSDTKTAENIKNVNAAIAAGTQDLEVKAARIDMDGKEHGSLKERLESDLKKGKLIEETKEGTYLSFNDTVGGIVSDIEVLGNTVQDISNLANIRSSCIPNGDGTFKMSILSCGENLLKPVFKLGNLSLNNADNTRGHSVFPVKVLSNSNISINVPNGYGVMISKVDVNNIYISNLSSGYLQNNHTVNVGDSKFIGIQFKRNDNAILSESEFQNLNIKLQEGTVATPYTPYQETRCDIKLPCQLEKWDRLYFDKEENAWCVDKGTKKKFVEEFKLIQGATADGLTNYHLKDLKAMNTGRVDDIICNKLIYNSSSVVKISKYPDGTEAVMRLNSSEFDTLQKVLDWSKSNQVYVLFYSDTPQKIVLPQSEQIKLNSFANKTHIYAISGELDATVKATVSKSLASTVQANTNEINILSDKIADIQGLKESQDFAYETDKGYLVCKDTQNGVVKDLNIYGKSLVNIATNSKLTVTNTSNHILSRRGFKKGEVFTMVIFLKSKNATGQLYLNYSATIGSTSNSYLNLSNSESVVVRKFDILADEQNWGFGGRSDFNGSVDVEVVLLEGDHTQNPPQYFEGIASVGNGNEIEVLSSNYGFNSTIMFKEIDYNTGNEIESNKHIISDFNYIKYDKDVSMTCNGVTLSGAITKRYYDINKKYLGDVKTNNVFYVRFRKLFNEGEINKNNVYKFSSNIIDISPEYKQDKKTILFKDTDNTWKPITNLRGIDENNCDVVDSVNNKFTEKIDKTVLNGSENWVLGEHPGTNTISFACNIVNRKFGVLNMICDKLPIREVYSEDYEGIRGYSSSNLIMLRINRNRLSSPDLIGFKKWLQDNNIELEFVRTDINQYEINPIFPNSYENETMILFSSGAIAPHAEWKISSSLPNFLQNIEDRVSRLENDTYKTNLANFAVALNMLDMKARLRSLGAPIN